MGGQKVLLGGECLEKDCSRMAALFVTSSRYKYDMFRAVLDIPVECVSVEIEEVQGSKEDIVRRKLERVSHLATETTVVFIDDTSIHLKGLHGFPGQYAKDFLGIGMGKVVEIAGKVGTECLYSTIIGLAFVQNGELVTRLFDGDVLGDIRLEHDSEPRYFQDIFVARREEWAEGAPSDGTMIGRSKAAKKIRRYLVDSGIYERLFAE